MRPPVRAVVWDYDNTLVDSRERNLAVTRRIVADLLGSWEDFPILSSLDSYQTALWSTQNWRDLYGSQFAMDDDQVDQAGRLWTDYQIEENTEAPILPGIPEALAALRHLPNGIVSANSRRNIRQTLRAHRLRERFEVIIGYEEVHLRAQKPAPDGLLLCVERLRIQGKCILLYVGDHEVDAECAANANAELERRNVEVRVASVGADYGRSESPDWSVEPDYRAGSPGEIVRLVKRLENGPSEALTSP